MPFDRNNLATRQRKKRQNKEIDRNVPKTEGTSQTYGQFIQKSSAPSLTKDAGFSRTVARGSFSVNAASPASPEPSFRRRRGRVVGKKLSDDTLVRVVQRLEDDTEDDEEFACKSQSSIAMVAAIESRQRRGRNETSVVLSKDRLFSRGVRGRSSLFGSALGDFATATPNVVDYVVVRGSTVKRKEEIQKAVEESQKVDFSLALKSQHSDSVEFNNIKTPDLEVEFVYNFFAEDEEDIESQEDPEKDPLLEERPISVPKYVELKWNPAQVTEIVTGTEEATTKNKKVRRGFFALPKGNFSDRSLSLPNSITRNRKSVNFLKKDGLNRSVMDIHKLERAFDFIANSRAFGNSVKTVVNVEDTDGVVTSIPIKE